MTTIFPPVSVTITRGIGSPRLVIVKLRAERARLLGFLDFAHYRLDDAMAKTPAAVRDLLGAVWSRARQKALDDRDAMQALVGEGGGNFALEPWDWRYYAEKHRQRACDFDEAAIAQILLQTLGYPYFLQEWGKHSWDVADASPIARDDAEQATTRALAELDRNPG